MCGCCIISSAYLRLVCLVPCASTLNRFWLGIFFFDGFAVVLFPYSWFWNLLHASAHEIRCPFGPIERFVRAVVYRVSVTRRFRHSRTAMKRKHATAQRCSAILCCAHLIYRSNFDILNYMVFVTFCKLSLPGFRFGFCFCGFCWCVPFLCLYISSVSFTGCTTVTVLTR